MQEKAQSSISSELDNIALISYVLDFSTICEGCLLTA
jgi:hypothetical protein